MGQSIAGLLLAAIGGGYWVLERASAQKGQLKKVGLFIGSFIIIASLLSALGQMSMVCAWKKEHGYGMGGKGWCPFTHRGDGEQSPAKP